MLRPDDDGTEDLLIRTVQRFVTEKLKPLEDQVDRDDHLDGSVIRKLKQEACALGLTGFNLPQSAGGPGLSVRTQGLIGVELGRTTMPLMAAVGRLPGSLAHCDEDQRRRYLEPALRAEKNFAYALTEPDAGSDLGAITTRARETADGWVLNGSKTFISHLDHADHIVVLAVTDPDAKLTKKLTTFFVDKTQAGLQFSPRFRTLGWRGYDIGGFSLQDVVVPTENILGGLGNGLATIMATINNDRLFVAFRCVGMAKALIEMAVEHARTRKTFGVLLGEHQAIQTMLADSDVECEAALQLCLRGAELGDAGSPEFRIAASRAKLYASEMVGRVADRVLQIFGGAGFMADLPIERFYRDARAFRIGEGTSEMQRNQIARNMLA